MKTDLVIGGFLIHNNKVLLIHHKKLNLWLPPGGHIDENEVPDDALMREFKEEVSLDIEIIHQNNLPVVDQVKRQLAIPFHVNIHNVGDHDHCCFFYLCKLKDSSEVLINKSEILDYKWFSVEELNQDIISADVRNIALKGFNKINKETKENS